jgi:hypothetical protein
MSKVIKLISGLKKNPTIADYKELIAKIGGAEVERKLLEATYVPTKVVKIGRVNVERANMIFKPLGLELKPVFVEPMWAYFQVSPIQLGLLTKHQIVGIEVSDSELNKIVQAYTAKSVPIDIDELYRQLPPT